MKKKQYKLTVDIDKKLRERLKEVAGYSAMTLSDFVCMVLESRLHERELTGGRAITVRQFMKELEALEPRGIVNYILKGSALNQWRNEQVK